jgi:hypothetical protein
LIGLVNQTSQEEGIFFRIPGMLTSPEGKNREKMEAPGKSF